MEEAIKKFFGASAKSVEVLPAFQSGGDLHIARAKLAKDAKIKPRPAWMESLVVRGSTAVIYLYASKVPAVTAAAPATKDAA